MTKTVSITKGGHLFVFTCDDVHNDDSLWLLLQSMAAMVRGQVPMPPGVTFEWPDVGMIAGQFGKRLDEVMVAKYKEIKRVRKKKG